MVSRCECSACACVYGLGGIKTEQECLSDAEQAQLCADKNLVASVNLGVSL